MIIFLKHHLEIAINTIEIAKKYFRDTIGC